MMTVIRQKNGDAAANDTAFIVDKNRNKPWENGRQQRAKQTKKEALLRRRNERIVRNGMPPGTVTRAAAVG